MFSFSNCPILKDLDSHENLKFWLYSGFYWFCIDLDIGNEMGRIKFFDKNVSFWITGEFLKHLLIHSKF